MRCRSCDYLLWNLRSRVCPECGQPFVPSDFELKPNAVKYCCPHCDQAYYGTDEKGHLTPRTFDCVTCGQHIDMDDMLVLPIEGEEDVDPAVDRHPWLHRTDIGVFRALFRMIGYALAHPYRLMRATPQQSSLGSAFWFAAFSSMLFAGSMMLPWIALMLLFMGPRGAGGGVGMSVGFGFAAAVYSIGFTLAILPWGLITHGMLRITGETAGTLRRTYQALCYSAGANVFVAVPCLGGYFGNIWGIVAAVLMVKEAQKVSGLRAAFAVLLAPGLLLLSIIAFYVFTIYMALSGTGGFPAAFQSLMSVSTPDLLAATLDYAQENDGDGPAHALMLLDNADDAWEFIGFDTETTPYDVPWGEGTLADIADLDRVEWAKRTAAMAALLPADVAAHRVGDFVFCYHGIDLSEADPNLWVVVFWPDPDANSGPVADSWIEIGKADGALQRSARAAFAHALKDQNLLRAQYDLPPLPHPGDVTHIGPPPAPPSP